MLRALSWAWIFVPMAAAAAGVEYQDLSADIRQLETGDWSARIRTVHELEYLQDAGLPALAVAAEDGDWQVRMAAVQALSPLGPKATLLLRSIMKNEKCPVVRLVALHNLGSLAAEGEEAQAIDWMLSASGAQVNACRDQSAPGRAPWASRLAHPVRKNAAPLHEIRADAPAPPMVAAPESRELATALGLPKTAGQKSAAEFESPTKDARYAELDALLAEPAKESLDDARGIDRRPVSSADSGPMISTEARANERPTLAQRRTASPQTLPRPVVTTPAPERSVEAAAAFEAAGGKAPHDAIPDLILALKSRNARARARAADELGSFGAGAASAVPSLMAALKDKSPRVRASASLALGNIGADDENVVALLAKALKDKSLDVRYAATLALSRIGTPAARKAYKARLGEDARRAIEQP